MTDAYALWRAELETPTAEADRLQRPTVPSLVCGFWRIGAARIKIDNPVAIWPETGDQDYHILFQIGLGKKDDATGKSFFSDLDGIECDKFFNGQWLDCTAVSEADYHSAMETKRWPDGKAARFISETEKLDLMPDTPSAEGGNNPVGEDGQPLDLFHQQVTEKIDAALAKAEALPFPITTMEDAQKGAEIIETLTGLGKQGEAKRKAEKQPHIDAAAAVDAKWSPVRSASEMVAKLKGVIETFKRAETARLQKIADEAARVERKRLQDIADAEAEERRVALQAQLDAEAEQRGVAAERVVVEAEVVEVKAETVTAPKVSSTYGRAVSTPKIKTATINDAKALALHLLSVEDIELWDCLQKRANAAARAKIALPGCEIEK